MAERAKAWWRAGGLILGAALVAGAIWYASQRVDFAAIRQAQAWQLAAITGGVIANLLTTTLFFWVVTLPFKPHPPVTYRKMLALICSSGLLNYLPLQAGTVGRSAYLVSRHGVSAMDAVKIVLFAISFTVFAAMMAGGSALTLAVRGSEPLILLNLSLWTLFAFVLPAALLGLHLRSWWPAVWLPVRVLDLPITSLRLWVAFRAVGHPVSPLEALIAAAASSLASVLSLTPNGLGLREWAVALTQGPFGVLATLLDRAVEAVVLVVAGIVGIANLKKAKPQAASGETE
jgi:uncharacterized membrane protein YbhN (UPF0104 family)